MAIVFVDPQTMQNFFNALIPLMIAAGVALQQYNAMKGKQRGEEAKQQAADAAAASQAAATIAASTAIQVADHNSTVTQKLETLQATADQTNTVVKNGGTH